jgi:hypothetical protein
MKNRTKFAIAMPLVAASIVAGHTAASAVSDTRSYRAMPAAQEETIYRPECPGNETSNAWMACRLADGDEGRR